MLELVEGVKEDLTKIADDGTDSCTYRDCRGCILSCFDNTNISCQDIAKELLKLINIQEYLKPVPFHKIYTKSYMKNWSKEDLIEHIECLQHNYSIVANSYDRQSDIFIKFFTEQKGKIEVTLKYKEK